MNRGLLILFAAFLICSCSDDSNDTEQYLGPGNIEVEVELKGSHDAKLLGDGSGVVYIWVKAKNTDQFKVYSDGIELRRYSSGYFRFIANKPGIHEYEVEIQATNTTHNLSKSKMILFKVNKIYSIPESLYKNLMLGNKKWRIDTSVDKPVTIKTVSGEYLGHNLEMEAKYASMYDDVYEFGFESITHKTMGQIVGKEGPLNQDFGSISDEANEDGEYENYPMESYSTNWLYAGDWTLNFEGKGFIGSYVGGNHVYEIQWHSSTQFQVRTLGDDNNYWYFLLTSKELVD